MTKTQSPTPPPCEAKMLAREKLIERAVNLYGLRLVFYIQGFTHDRAKAEDILQSLWLKVIEDFDAAHILQLGMLKRKARQLITDEKRRTESWNGVMVSIESLPDVEGGHVFHECATIEEENGLKNAFWSNFPGLTLTEKERDAFWLKERYGYTIIEIAAHLQLPHATIQDWVAKARRECAKYIELI